MFSHGGRRDSPSETGPLSVITLFTASLNAAEPEPGSEGGKDPPEKPHLFTRLSCSEPSSVSCPHSMPGRWVAE